MRKASPAARVCSLPSRLSQGRRRDGPWAGTPGAAPVHMNLAQHLPRERRLRSLCPPCALLAAAVFSITMAMPDELPAACPARSVGAACAGQTRPRWQTRSHTRIAPKRRRSGQGHRHSPEGPRRGHCPGSTEEGDGAVSPCPGPWLWVGKRREKHSSPWAAPGASPSPSAGAGGPSGWSHGSTTRCNAVTPGTEPVSAWGAPRHTDQPQTPYHRCSSVCQQPPAFNKSSCLLCLCHFFSLPPGPI